MYFGPSVAQGYLGRPDLTADKFIENPWAMSVEEELLYRTGDLAKIDEFGQVHCLGRADDQVKIRGFRVELGEIEAALCDIDGIGTAAVILRPEDGIDQLIAFIAPEIDAKQAIEIKELRHKRVSDYRLIWCQIVLRLLKKFHVYYLGKLTVKL